MTTLLIMLLLAVFGFVPLARGEAALPVPDAEGFICLFNGKDLNDWDGDPKFWSVKDGAIVGETTPENKTGGTYLFRKNITPIDFELRVKFRLPTGNSGIQYRSQQQPNWQVTGYQADMDAGNAYTGILYEAGGRGIAVLRGQKVEFDADCQKKVVGSLGTADEPKAAIKYGDWNEYVVIAKGNHVIHQINGKVMVEFTDDCPKKINGTALAFQLHPGPPMRVEFKDIRLRPLNP